jgi:ElaB/YqjD/DUF883 family membrane-anchored ribosome-binding protein
MNGKPDGLTKEQRRERQLEELAGSDLATIEGRPPGAPPPEDAADDDTAEERPAAQAQAPAPRGDPAVDITEVQEKRIRAVIEDHTDAALSELTDLRDKADQLMHTIRDANAQIIDQVTTHARRVAKAIKAKSLIARALADIEAEFAQPQNGKGNAVITQQKK